MPGVENKEKILNTVREKCHLAYKGRHIGTTELSTKNLRTREAMGQYVSTSERK
jgi:hypothetical protein